MAARKSAGADESEQTPAATIRTQQYDGGVGWEVGQRAPETAYRAYAADGSGAVTGPVVYEHPGGAARQIVAKGGLVTDGVKRELAAAEQSDEGEQG